MRRLVMLVLLLAMAACGDPEVAADSSTTTSPSRSGLPAGRTFVARSVRFDGADRPLVARVALEFTEGRVQVATGCNGGSGRSEIENGRLVITDLTQTEMGCEEPRMAQEEFVTKFLSASPTFTLTGDELLLVAGDDEMLLVDRKVAEPDRPLEGTTWRLDGQFDPQVASSAAGADVDLVFAAGQVKITSACGSATGPATITGTTIRFGSLVVSGQQPCEGEKLTPTLNLLSGELTAKVSAGGLRLTRPDGKGLDLRVR